MDIRYLRLKKTKCYIFGNHYCVTLQWAWRPYTYSFPLWFIASDVNYDVTVEVCKIPSMYVLANGFRPGVYAGACRCRGNYSSSRYVLLFFVRLASASIAICRKECRFSIIIETFKEVSTGIQVQCSSRLLYSEEMKYLLPTILNIHI